MYNSTQKTEFLEASDYHETSIELIKLIFNNVETEEIRLQKDLSRFTEIEVQELLKSFNSKSKARLRMTCAYLSGYYKWCLNNGLTEIKDNPYDANKVDGFILNIIPSDIIEEKYFNHDAFISKLKKIKDNTNQFIVYAIYSGIKGDEYVELTNLKITDLDEVKKTVRLITGRTVNVNDMFIDLMKKANECTYYFADGIEKSNLYGRYSYAESGYVLKSCGNGSHAKKPIGLLIINPRLAVIKKQVGNEFFTVSTIYKNGLINYVKEKFDGKGIDLKTALLSKDNEKLYVFDIETQQYINEFGSKMTAKMLRHELKDYL